MLVVFLCSRFLEAVERLPVDEPKGPGWVVAAELKSVLEQLELHMDQSEFDKLWKRFIVHDTAFCLVRPLSRFSNVHVNVK